uniref:Envelope protein n=1 Tax=Chionoecetes opilio bacilliform virus TaxID=1825681 RepID=A0A1Q3DL92_9VIRU|nr:wsv306-like protein [Chionoecetes opilio bacilliform virus]GAV93232.1 envelope protein [Chionoecetes opilio bacilliform virus]
MNSSGVEIASVGDNHVIHGWASEKTNCEAVDTHCNSDKDCTMACSTLHSEDGREITRFVCNFESGRCNKVVYNVESYARAIRDLGNIMSRINTDTVYASSIPEPIMWSFTHNNGHIFVSKRAVYYDLIGMAMSQLTNTHEIVESVEKRNAGLFRERFYGRLDHNLTDEEYNTAADWIDAITSEADETEGEQDEKTLSHFLRGVTGFSLANAIQEDASGETVQEYLVNNVPDFIPEDEPSNPITLKAVVKRRERRSVNIVDSRVDNLCNEHMHAGRLESIYETDTGERVGVCSCTYREYLTGPMCFNRTYRYVIDYDKWAETGWPDFLFDPVRHFTSANAVCQSLGRNAVAEYSHEDEAFVCVTIADIVKNSLSFVGSFEPSLIIERDVNKVSNAPHSSFGPSWEYVNLLERLEPRIE